MIDIERTIDAHYGILEKIEDQENLSYICILPKNVYDIRPITLDLNCPNVKDLSYNYPEAEKLENKFFEKISDFQVCQNKIKKAVDYIKIYHRHQTRKSGEPYYLHPINVAIIAIDIAKKSNTKIHDFLMKNIEKIIIVSLLHDILEDTYIKKKNILQNFGSEILSFIESITKTDFEKREFLLSNDLAFFNLINEQPIVVCVKIADRIHNLKTIDGHSKIEKRKKIAEETIAFFIKVAEKYEMKNTIKKLYSMSSYIIQNGKIEGYKD
jgi:(p)ppGpp synthase/HD superfamily hydrolase